MKITAFEVDRETSIRYRIEVHEVLAPETLQGVGVPPERAKKIIDYHTTAEQAGTQVRWK